MPISPKEKVLRSSLGIWSHEINVHWVPGESMDECSCSGRSVDSHHLPFPLPSRSLRLPPYFNLLHQVKCIVLLWEKHTVIHPPTMCHPLRATVLGCGWPVPALSPAGASQFHWVSPAPVHQAPQQSSLSSTTEGESRRMPDPLVETRPTLFHIWHKKRMPAGLSCYVYSACTLHSHKEYTNQSQSAWSSTYQPLSSHHTVSAQCPRTHLQINCLRKTATATET
jgi:hypothetical protein